MEESIEVPQKTKHKTTIRSSNSTPGHTSGEDENSNLKRYIAGLFTTVKTRKQLKCPSADERIKNMWCAYTMEHYSAIKRDEIMPFSNMDGPRYYHPK